MTPRTLRVFYLLLAVLALAVAYLIGQGSSATSTPSPEVTECVESTQYAEDYLNAFREASGQEPRELTAYEQIVAECEREVG